MSQPENTTVMRSFTRAFKIPILIGKFEGGVSLPGGPYALVQIVAGVVAYLGAIVLRPVWGQWGVLDFIAAVIPAVAVGFLAGKVSFGARGPVAITASLLGGMSAPAFGSCHGKAMTWPGRTLADLLPARPCHQVLVLADGVTAAPARPDPAPEAVAHPVAGPALPALPTRVPGVPAPGEPQPATVRHTTDPASPVRSTGTPAAPPRRVNPTPVTAIERLLAAAEKVS